MLTVLPRLQELVLWNLSDPDRDLTAIAGCNNLQILDVAGTRLTDVGMTHLKGLVDMRRLRLLSGPQITGAGLESLLGMRRLKVLCFEAARVETIKSIRQLAGLETLALDRNPIGDDGLVPLADLTALTSLGLNETRVTDAGLVNLKRLQGQKYVGRTETDPGYRCRARPPRRDAEPGKARTGRNGSHRCRAEGPVRTPGPSIPEPERHIHHRCRAAPPLGHAASPRTLDRANEGNARRGRGVPGGEPGGHGP